MEDDDPRDKSLATYDHDEDPNNDPRFWCVFDDDGYRAEGFATRAEADAYEQGMDYCHCIEISIKGVFEADSEEEAIAKAREEDDG